MHLRQGHLAHPTAVGRQPAVHTGEGPDLRAVVDAARTTLMVVDLTGTITFASGAVRELAGVEQADAVGQNVLDWLHPDDVEHAAVSLAENQRARGLRYFPMSFRLRHADGHVVEVDVLVTNRLDDPAIGGIVLSIQAAEDRTQYVDPIRALAAGADHGTVLRLIAAGVGRGGNSLRQAFVAASPDLDGRFREVHAVRAGAELTMLVSRYVELASAELAELGAGDLRSVPAFELDDDFRAWASAHGIAGLRMGGIGVQGRLAGVLLAAEPVATWSRGEWSPSTVHHWCQLLELGTIAFERHRFHSRMLHAATHDDLTGLANRAHFFDRLSRFASRTTVGVLYLDLDKFKRINDTRGHLFGDAVLAEIGRRLSAVTRAGDLVARLGGDEFAVAVPEASPEVIDEMAARISAGIAAPMPEHLGGLVVTASIGTAIVPRGSDVDRLVHSADLEMLGQKRRRAHLLAG